MLRDSTKPQGLLNMTDISVSRYAEGTIPTAFITGEGYRMIWRLMKHGPVTVEIEMTNTFGNKAGRGLQHRCRSARLGKAG